MSLAFGTCPLDERSSCLPFRGAKANAMIGLCSDALGVIASFSPDLVCFRRVCKVWNLCVHAYLFSKGNFGLVLLKGCNSDEYREFVGLFTEEQGLAYKVSCREAFNSDYSLWHPEVMKVRAVLVVLARPIFLQDTTLTREVKALGVYDKTVACAVKKDPFALEYVDCDYLSVGQYFDIVLHAVQSDWMALEFVKPSKLSQEQYAEVVTSAVQQAEWNGWKALEFVRSERLSCDEYCKILKNAVSQDGSALQFMDVNVLPKEKVCEIVFFAVHRTPLSLREVRSFFLPLLDPEEYLCVVSTALKKEPLTLQYVSQGFLKSLTTYFNVIEVAIASNPNASLSLEDRNWLESHLKKQPSSVEHFARVLLRQDHSMTLPLFFRQMSTACFELIKNKAKNIVHQTNAVGIPEGTIRALYGEGMW